MCVEHADTIDNPATIAAYPAERLRKWKAEQLDDYERLKQGWALNSDMAREVMDASFSNAEIVFNHSTVHLAGEGGRAPGAGGGGGGAVGRSSRGGRGGDGGGHRIERDDCELPWAEDASKPSLMPHLFRQAGFEPDFNPGAGGGGAGSIGDGTRGGDGGGGGESFTGLIDLTEPEEGWPGSY